jgi:hypothetical protein
MSTREDRREDLGIRGWELSVYRGSFLLAVVYNVVWGCGVILFPRAGFALAGMEEPGTVGLLLWQCIGMFVLVYAVGYWYLWRDPLRYAPFALVAVLGKVFGPIGWVWGWWQGALPGWTGLTILTNDLLWWPVWFPFVYKAVIRPAWVSKRSSRLQAGDSTLGG